MLSHSIDANRWTEFTLAGQAPAPVPRKTAAEVRDSINTVGWENCTRGRAVSLARGGSWFVGLDSRQVYRFASGRNSIRVDGAHSTRRAERYTSIGTFVPRECRGSFVSRSSSSRLRCLNYFILVGGAGARMRGLPIELLVKDGGTDRLKPALLRCNC